MRPRPSARLASALLLIGASAAAAHAPFLAPESFVVSRDWVTVTAGMHEETPLVPDFAIRAPGDLWATGPDGRTVKVEGVVQLKGLNAADVPVPTAGLYRVSTGARVARETTWAQVDGAWRPIRTPRPGGGEGGAPPRDGHLAAPARHEGDGPAPLDAAPPGAPAARTTAYLRADAYVVRGGAPTSTPRPDGAGLELAPAADPTAIYLDTAFPLTVLLDGRPAPGAQLLVRRADGPYAERKTTFTVVGDASGRASVKFPLPGAYVIEAQTAPAAAGARPPEKTYVSTLTVEVTP